MPQRRAGAPTEAMISDPVYEGESTAVLIDLVSRGDTDASYTADRSAD